MNDKTYNCISLFSGAGGLDLGFQEVGFKCLFACDIMSQAADSFAVNFPTVPFFNQDVRTISNEILTNMIGNQKVDVIIGGPPCQGFSNMGNKNSADPRNFLFENYVRIVKFLKPVCFVFENVKGLLTMFEGRFFKMVVDAFTEIGYKINCSLIDMSLYGVPQKRERLIIVGSRLDREFQYPFPSRLSFGRLKSYSNVGEAIMDLADKGSEVPNHIALRHSDVVKRRYQLIPEGGKLPKPEFLPEDIRRKNFGNTYTRLSRKDVSSTIVPGNNALPVHPTLDRSLTPREGARIQTFPDNFLFCGDRRSQCIQVGNAVPPLFAAKLANQLKLFISGEPMEGISPQMFFPKNCPTNTQIGNRQVRATLKFADLFCGVGGFTKGLEMAGLECVLGVDFDKYAMEAYHKNYTHEALRLDLSIEENQNLVADKIKRSGADLVVGGPPCQGFSIFGKRRFVNTKKHDLTQDKRNNLVYAYANIVVKSGVNWFIMENVPGILSAHGGEYISSIREFFTQNGFRTEYKIINAADYGAPQLRKRFILIGTKTTLLIPFPKPKYFENPESWQFPYRTVGEVITDLADETTLGNIPNHNAPKHSKVFTERLRYINEGEKMDVSLLPDELKIGTKTGKPLANFSHVYMRLARNKPSRTIVPGHNALPIHPFLNRSLTVREAARIQTFPDSIIFVGPVINQCLQVGNAFPCIVAQTFGERLRTVINKAWEHNDASNLANSSMFDYDKDN